MSLAAKFWIWLENTWNRLEYTNKYKIQWLESDSIIIYMEWIMNIYFYYNLYGMDYEFLL